MTGRALDVLIVEDEMLLAIELEFLVREVGCHALGLAMSSDEAVALAKELKPDLALVDVHLSDGPTGVTPVGPSLRWTSTSARSGLSSLARATASSELMARPSAWQPTSRTRNSSSIARSISSSTISTSSARPVILETLPL